jgi:hypothetical protein
MQDSLLVSICNILEIVLKTPCYMILYNTPSKQQLWQYTKKKIN